MDHARRGAALRRLSRQNAHKLGHMALSPIAPAHSWPDGILEAAREFFNGSLSIYIPGEPGAYDPVTDTMTGGTPDVAVIADRPARAQHLRSPQDYHDGSGWDVKRVYRFQCEILPGDPSITKGMVAKFTGGRDPELAKVEFQVVTATNSSHAALRTVECVSELSRA